MDALTSALTGEFYVDADMIRDAIQRRASFNVVHLATMFKADIFIFQGDSWSREEMARARVEQLDAPEGKVTIRFASPEDTLLHKMIWYKLGNQISDRQWGDILGVLKVQGEALDHEPRASVASVVSVEGGGEERGGRGTRRLQRGGGVGRIGGSAGDPRGGTLFEMGTAAGWWQSLPGFRLREAARQSGLVKLDTSLQERGSAWQDLPADIAPSCKRSRLTVDGHVYGYGKRVHGPRFTVDGHVHGYGERDHGGRSRRSRSARSPSARRPLPLCPSPYTWPSTVNRLPVDRPALLPSPYTSPSAASP